MKKISVIFIVLVIISICASLSTMRIDNESFEETELSSIIAEKAENLANVCSMKAELSKKFLNENGLEDSLEDVTLSLSAKKTIKEVKVLYDFINVPLFLSVSFIEGGYAIERLESEAIYERTDYGASPYDGIETKCYYMGTGLYFYEKSNNVIEIATQKTVEASVKNKMQDELYRTITREIYYENSQQVSETETVSDSSTRSTMYLIGLQNQNDYKKAYYFFGLDSYIYDYTYAQNGKKDLIFPVNTTNSCAAVAVTMILQYYDRLGLFKSINSRFDQYLLDRLPSYDKLIYDNKNNNPTLTKSQFLHNYIEANLDQWIWGETYNTGIAEYMPKYFKAEQLEENKLVFTANTFWANMKENIDRNMPCIGMVGTGTGYYGNPNAPGYVSDTINGHQMVVYGYTKNSLGGLDEFICHRGWHQQKYLASCIYTSGWSFAGNVTVTENF